MKKHQCPNQNSGASKFGELLLSTIWSFPGRKQSIKNEWWLECAQCCCPSHFRCLELLPLVLMFCLIDRLSGQRGAAVTPRLWSAAPLNAETLTFHWWHFALTVEVISQEERSQLCVHVKFEACRDRKMIMFHVALGELLDNVRKGQILTLDLTA